MHGAMVLILRVLYFFTMFWQCPWGNLVTIVDISPLSTLSGISVEIENYQPMTNGQYFYLFSSKMCLSSFGKYV